MSTAQQQQRWIWPFELQDKLGEGGMGVVYRARYVVKNWPVAVKLLPDHIASNPTMVARFERELEVLNKLRHPHIVRCFGGKCESNQRFYAMELVEGGTLDDIITKKGRLGWEQAVEYAEQMCSALEYAHELGIIHRDIKPGNFLVTPTGKLKLSDFGLAAVVAGNRITAAGKTLGTFHYMAPEQIRGKPPVSAKTDLYALGCVIFEMLTGHPPFDGETPAEILHQHLRDKPPRVAAEVTDCPAALDQLVSHLLDKDPEQRPASAHVVLERLRAISPTVYVDPSQLTRTMPVAPTIAPDLESLIEAPRVRATGLWASGLWASGGVMQWAGWGVAALLLIACLLIWRNGRGAAQVEQLWLESYRSPSPIVRVAAAHALGKLGTQSDDAIEALLTGLADNDATVRAATAAALGEAGVAGRPASTTLLKLQQQDGDPQVRFAAQSALEQIRSAKEGWSPWPWLIGGSLLALCIAAVVVWSKSDTAAR